MNVEHIYIIETQRLILKGITLNTYHAIFNTLSDEDGVAFLGFSKHNFLKEKKRYQSNFFNEGKSLLYFLIFDKQRGENIGWCGFHTWSQNLYCAEIGFEIYSEEFKRLGLMSEAIRKVINFGFESMALKKIKAFIKSQNVASIHLIKTINFTKEATINKVKAYENKSENVIAFSLDKKC